MWREWDPMTQEAEIVADCQKHAEGENRVEASARLPDQFQSPEEDGHTTTLGQADAQGKGKYPVHETHISPAESTDQQKMGKQESSRGLSRPHHEPNEGVREKETVQDAWPKVGPNQAASCKTSRREASLHR